MNCKRCGQEGYKEISLGDGWDIFLCYGCYNNLVAWVSVSASIVRHGN